MPEPLFCREFFCRPEACNFIKKRLWHNSFHVNFAKFLRTPFWQNTSGRLLLIHQVLFFKIFLLITRTITNEQNKVILIISSAIRQKGKSQNRCYKKVKPAEFLIRAGTCAYQRGKKCSFYGNFGVLCFLLTPL